MNKDELIIFMLRALKELNVYQRFATTFNAHLLLPDEQRLGIHKTTLYCDIKCFEQYLELLATKVGIRSLFSDAFVWDRTKEGYCFWRNVCDKYIDLYHKFYNTP